MEYNNHNNLYISQVIKYKIKYIKLEQQIGGSDDTNISQLQEDDDTGDLVANYLKINSAIDAADIAHLVEHDNLIIRTAAHQKYNQLSEQPVAAAIVAQPVAVVQHAPIRDNLNEFLPPDKLPERPTTFYMPLITEAYYLARDIEVPPGILNRAGRIINLGHINEVQYNQMVISLSNYLSAALPVVAGAAGGAPAGTHRLVFLEQKYAEGDLPTAEYVGRIAPGDQELILDRVFLNGNKLKVLLDIAILRHYLPRDLTLFPPPPSMPKTMSQFYMPLITEAYYLAGYRVVPPGILNRGGRIINLGHINEDQYNQMVVSLSEYLLVDSRRDLLTEWYNAPRQTPPNDNASGHISADNQETILNGAHLDGKNLREILDNAIVRHYYPHH